MHSKYIEGNSDEALLIKNNIFKLEHIAKSFKKNHKIYENYKCKMENAHFNMEYDRKLFDDLLRATA